MTNVLEEKMRRLGGVVAPPPPLLVASLGLAHVCCYALRITLTTHGWLLHLPKPTSGVWPTCGCGVVYTYVKFTDCF